MDKTNLFESVDTVQRTAKVAQQSTHDSGELIGTLDAVLITMQQVENEIAARQISTALRQRLSDLARLSRRLSRKCNHKDTPATKPTSKVSPALDDLHKRLALVRDRVRAVAVQGQPGFYLYGRAGTAKTYTVLTTLDKLGIPYYYQNGHLTPIGLFGLLEEHSDSIIVLDDVATIFAQPTAKNLLLAALGKQPNGERIVKYTRKSKKVTVRFRGGIIAISNLELHGDELIAALRSRVQTLKYDPSDEHIIALMGHIASKGHTLNSTSLSAKDCQKVCDYLLQLCKDRQVRPDIRMLVDKAFA